MIATRWNPLGKDSKGYQVEYLESNGAQYIDTGIEVNLTTITTQIRATVLWTKFTGVRQLFGADYRRFFGVDGNGKDYLNTSVQFSTNVKYNYEIDYDHQTKDISYKCLKNGEVISSIFRNVSGFGAQAYNLFLFALRGETYVGGYNFLCNARMYSYEVWSNGVLEGNFLPWVDKDGVACVKNAVNGQLLYNGLTEPFIAGERV